MSKPTASATATVRRRPMFMALALAMALAACLSPLTALAQDAAGTPRAGNPDAGPKPLVVVQPSYDSLRVEDRGAIQPYHLWVDWMPVLVTTEDGGAWLFFGAQARAEQGFGDRRLFASRFDPESQVWLPAQVMPGGTAQFGATAAVDTEGVVHVVYSDVRDPGAAGAVLVHVRSDGAGGWTEPVPIAPDPNAGYQMMASLAADDSGGLHVLWRDQRFADPERRAAHPANGDLFSSDLVDGGWAAPVQVMQRPDGEVVAGWPHLAADGDRLVAVWSLYAGTGEEAMQSATRIEWATRPLSGSTEWSPAAAIVERETGEIGGRLIDLAKNPQGGLGLVSGRFEKGSNELGVFRLAPGADAWDGPLTATRGDWGYLPEAAFGADGELYLVFNSGRNRNVEVAALAVPDGADGGPRLPVILTPAEEGLQARAVVAVDADGQPWIAYMHQPELTGPATEIRALRDANIGMNADTDTDPGAAAP